MPKTKGPIVLPLEKEEILNDYRLAYQSRQASLIGRREVLSGKAKFGIFGDGKELAQLAPGSFQMTKENYARHQLPDPFVAPNGDVTHKPPAW